MKPGTILNELVIVDTGSEGEGIARHDGMVIFIKGAVPGDCADIRLLKKHKGSWQGKIELLRQASPHRIAPVCDHFGTCGGCKWQHMQYAAQLNFKQTHVEACMQRIAKVGGFEMRPILGAPDAFRYRNKMEFSFSAMKWLPEGPPPRGEIPFANPGLGFHIPGRFDKILHIDACHLMHDTHNEIRNFFFQLCSSWRIPFYNLKQHTGWLRSLLLRCNMAGEWMVILIVAERDEACINRIAEVIRQRFPQIKTFLWGLNAKRNDSLDGVVPELVYGPGYLEEELDSIRYRISPFSFFQTNSRQALNLYREAAALAEIRQHETVYDLYTGTGTIALFVAASAKKVIGIEYVESAVIDARLNAVQNKIDHANFFSGDMKDILSAAFLEEQGKPDVIITDPPRAGMHPDVVMRILESGAKRIVYISCNPSTQARDIALLAAGYETKVIQPVDMFPHTAHVENIALLTLRA